MRQVDLKLSFNTTLQRFSSQPFFFFLPSKKKLHLLNNEWVNSRRRVFFFARRDWRIEALLCRSLFNSCELKMSFQRAPVRLIFGWKTICAAAFYIDETLTPIELMYILVVNVVFSFYTYTFNPYMNFSFIAANQHYCNAHTHPRARVRAVGRPASQPEYTPIDGVSCGRVKSWPLLADFISSNMKFCFYSPMMGTCLHFTVSACTGVCSNRVRLILQASHAARYNLL